MGPDRLPLARRPSVRVGVALVAVTVIVAAAAACGDGSDRVLNADEARGRRIADDRNCLSCHTTDGSRNAGPTFKGLYGSTVTLTDGTTVTADDAYIARAVREPNAQVRQGFPATMPATPDISDAEIADITRYLRALR